MDTTKKKENRKPRKKGTEGPEGPETKEIVCKGLSLLPTHRDTKRDLKTEKEGVVVGHSKKRRN